MAFEIERTDSRTPGRLQAFLLAAAVPLFLGALLSDWAYWSSYEVQWSNFASWLLVGGLAFLAVAVLVALLELGRARRRGGRLLAHVLLLLASLVVGFLNALVHARDAWAVMPTGLALSLLVVVLVGMATWFAFSGMVVDAADGRRLP